MSRARSLFRSSHHQAPKLRFDKLPSSYTFTFALDVTNSMTGQSGTAIAEVFKSDSAQITALIDGRDSVYRTDEVILSGGFKLPVLTCIQGADATASVAQMKMIWSVTPAAEFVPAGASVSVQEGVLLPGTSYTFKLIIQTASTQYGGSQITKDVFVKRSPLVIRASGGSFLVAGLDVELSLDASGSFDPDDPTSQLTYTWTHNATGSELFLASGSSPTLMPRSTVCPSACTVRFTVLGVLGDRNGTASQVVQLVPGAPPVVAIDAPELINPTQQLRMDSTASRDKLQCASLAPTGTTCKADYGWSLLSNNLDLVTSAVSPSLLAAPSLLLKRYTTFGTTYVFQLTVRHPTETGGEGLAQVEVQGNDPPFGGALTVTPNISAFGSMLTFRVLGFTDIPEHLPLRYRFEYCLEGACNPSTKFGLSDPQMKPLYTNDQLPTGNLTIVVAAIDLYEAEANTTAAAEVRPPDVPDDSGMVNFSKSFFESKRAEQSLTGESNGAKALDTVAAVSSVLNSIKPEVSFPNSTFNGTYNRTNTTTTTTTTGVDASAGSVIGRRLASIGGRLLDAGRRLAESSRMLSDAAGSDGSSDAAAPSPPAESNATVCEWPCVLPQSEDPAIAAARPLRQQMVNLLSDAAPSGKTPARAQLKHMQTISTVTSGAEQLDKSMAKSSIEMISANADLLQAKGSEETEGRVEFAAMAGLDGALLALTSGLQELGVAEEVPNDSTPSGRRRRLQAAEASELESSQGAAQQTQQLIGSLGAGILGRQVPQQARTTVSSASMNLNVYRGYDPDFTDCAAGEIALNGTCCLMITPGELDPKGARVCMPKTGMVLSDGAVVDSQLVAYAVSPLSLFGEDDTGAIDATNEAAAAAATTQAGTGATIKFPHFTAQTVAYDLKITGNLEQAFNTSLYVSVVVWLPRLRYQSRKDSDFASSAKPECSTDADCVNENDGIFGVCNQATCDCPLPWVGMGCKHHHACRYFDSKRRNWVGDDACRIREELTEELYYVVCECVAFDAYTYGLDGNGLNGTISAVLTKPKVNDPCAGATICLAIDFEFKQFVVVGVLGGGNFILLCIYLFSMWRRRRAIRRCGGRLGYYRQVCERQHMFTLLQWGHVNASTFYMRWGLAVSRWMLINTVENRFIRIWSHPMSKDPSVVGTPSLNVLCFALEFNLVGYLALIILGNEGVCDESAYCEDDCESQVALGESLNGNGLCEDGGPGSVQYAAESLIEDCVSGTDCSDCGPRMSFYYNFRKAQRDPNAVDSRRF